MQVGLLIPQGWKGEYDGWEPAAAWQRSMELTRHAEAIGFESLWVFDHFHTVPDPTDEITFESFTMLTAMAMITERVRLGHMVVCTGFRNPAVTAKMSSTLDVISGGRFELGIGAGWKEDEWRAYGFGFPPIGERIGAFGDHLEIITRMFEPGHATFEGRFASVRDAINVPRGLQQPRIPIIVGGNGRDRTAGFAVKYADELNFVYIGPDEVARRIPQVQARCEAEGRDPATLRFSLYIGDDDIEATGPARVDLLARLAATGLDRIVAFPGRYGATEAVTEAFAEDCLAAGLSLGAPAPVTAGT